MRIPVKSRVHRILRHLPDFSAVDKWEHLDEGSRIEKPIAPDETLLGVYHNHRGSFDEVLMFTDQGLYARELNKWRRIRYSEIARTEWPKGPKTRVELLELTMKDGRTEVIKVLGGKSGTRDLFEVIRFLERVIMDTEADANSAKG